MNKADENGLFFPCTGGKDLVLLVRRFFYLSSHVQADGGSEFEVER